MAHDVTNNKAEHRYEVALGGELTPSRATPG
jgi:hypothetical protein